MGMGLFSVGCCPCGPGSNPGGFGSLPFCFCAEIPLSLTMVSADETCNYQMFQSCTIAYQTTPAIFAPFNLGANCYLSTQSFPDPTAEGATFVYYLSCLYNQFNLTRLYTYSPFGSPFRDGVLYSWLVGGQGNSCGNVFLHLNFGTSFPGSDLSCNVTING